MPIRAQDIKLRASRVMADVPEGGGGPSAQEVAFGESNTVFDDIDSLGRTLGNASIRQLHMHVDTPSTDRLLGAYAIIAKLPADPNVSVTLATCAPFARRSEIATAIADYLIRGVRWNGFLLENHVQGQANIQIFQRPGVRKPTVGRTLVLVLNEGLPTEVLQYVRVIKVDSEILTFTDTNGDYQAEVVKCDLQSPLTRAWPGTAPNRAFTVGAAKTVLRDTSEADAANYYGAAATTAVANLGATSVKVASPYSQLVPSSTTSVPALDQRPAARKTFRLADAPRAIDVSMTPHTTRIKIGQENRGLSFVVQLTPPPEPGTIVATWVGLGNRYTIEDNGAGELTGAGAGTVNSATGSMAITLPSLPDVGSALVINWGTRIAYTNRLAQGAAVRAPEYAWIVEGRSDRDRIVPGAFTVRYPSGGTVRTVTDNGSGQLSGDATGVLDYNSRHVLLRPTYMPDPGAELLVECQMEELVTEIKPAGDLSPDPAGFVSFALAQQPAAGTLQLTWYTARATSNTSGATLSTTSAIKNTNSTTTVTQVPQGLSLPGAPAGVAWG